MNASQIGVVGLLAVTLLLVGCGSNNTAATATAPSPTPATSPTPAPAPTPTQRPRTLTFKLNGRAGYTASGTVRVDINVYGYTLTVTVKGLTPNTSHVLQIAGGNCVGVDPGFQLQVDHVKADPKGTIASLTTWHEIYNIPAEGRVFVVHGDDNSNGTAEIACAVLTN